MDIAQIKQTIRRELPTIMQEDPGMREFVLRLAREQFADKAETESRFDRLLAELRRDRKAQEKKWEAQEQRWAEHQQAQEQKWADNQAVINQMLKDIQGLFHKYDSSIGALGARWGMRSEQSFRNAL